MQGSGGPRVGAGAGFEGCHGLGVGRGVREGCAATAPGQAGRGADAVRPGGLGHTRPGRWNYRKVTESAPLTAEDEVARLCRDLIRIDTSNPGDHSGPGERAAAEHVAGLLSEVGLEPVVARVAPEADQRRRADRGRGQEPSRAAGARAPGRGARQRRRLAGRPVLRGDRGRRASGGAARST